MGQVFQFFFHDHFNRVAGRVGNDADRRPPSDRLERAFPTIEFADRIFTVRLQPSGAVLGGRFDAPLSQAIGPTPRLSVLIPFKGDDPCALQGRYDDRRCDFACAQPDGDCDDPCVEDNLFDDRICDSNCSQRDADCDDPCVLSGFYQDGICDENCFQPDPDC